MAAGKQHTQDHEPERPPAAAPAPVPASESVSISASEPVPDFSAVLRHLRARGEPCAPPSGVGSFLPLYANDLEVVVWYLPAREGHVPGEVAIPCARLAGAWARLVAGERLTRETLEAEGERPARALWLLALLAQVPGVRTQAEPLAVWWEPAADAPAPTPETSVQEAGRHAAKHTSGKPRTRSARHLSAGVLAAPSAAIPSTTPPSRRPA